MRSAEQCSVSGATGGQGADRNDKVQAFPDQNMNAGADRLLSQTAAHLAGLLPELLAQPLAAGPLVRLGEVCSLLGDAAAARICFERAAGIDGANSDAANNLGVLAFSAGDVDRAEWYFQRAMELDPENSAARENYRALAEVRAITPSEPKDGEIIIYQMGKVASSALNHALSQRELVVEASHFLGAEEVAKVVGELCLPWMDAHFTYHLSGQLVRNMVLTRKINWFREYGAARGRRLKIITLVRDPLDWYAASFIQDFAGYRDGIEAWRKTCSGLSATVTLPDKVAAFQRAVQERLLVSPEELLRWTPGQGNYSQDPGEGEGVAALGLLARLMARPLEWFDINFRPVLDVDVYAQPFDMQRGWSVINGEFADVLVLKFECLSELTDVIGRFAGVEDLEIARRNVTREKTGADDIKAAIRNAYTDELRHAIYATPYCRHFGYFHAPAVKA